jgi:hypothetical protein
MRISLHWLYLSVICVTVSFLGCGDVSLEQSRSVASGAGGGSARKTYRRPVISVTGPSLNPGVVSAGESVKISFVEETTPVSSSSPVPPSSPDSVFYRNLEIARIRHSKNLEACRLVKDEKSFTTALLELEAWRKMKPQVLFGSVVFANTAFGDEYNRVAAKYFQQKASEVNALLHSGGRSRDAFLRAKEVLFRIKNIFDAIELQEMFTQIIETLEKFSKILSSNFPEYKEAESVVDRLEVILFLVSAPEADAIVRLSSDQARRLVIFAGLDANRRMLKIANTNRNQIGRDAVSLMLHHIFLLPSIALTEIETWEAEAVNPIDDLEFNLLKDIFVKFQEVGNCKIDQLDAELRNIVAGNENIDETREFEIKKQLNSVIDQLIANWQKINS